MITADMITDRLNTAGPRALATNRLVIADTITRIDDGSVEEVYKALVDPDIVEPGVSAVFLDEWKPTSQEDLSVFLPWARHIKEMRIPFKYWLEQPCPVQGARDAPCIAIRRGVHEYLLETQPEYAAKQRLLYDLGYVEQGAKTMSFSIGHRPVGIESEDGTVVQNPATVWPIESFVLNGEGLILLGMYKPHK